MNLLIILNKAEWIKQSLESEFPGLAIHAVEKEEQALDIIDGIDILVAFRLSNSMLEKATNLKWIQAVTAGVDSFLDQPALRKELIITSASGMHGPQMSEMAILFMLAFNRNFPRNVKNQSNRIWERWPARLLSKKNVGILGVGKIGQEIARKCKAFDMIVYGINRSHRDLECLDYYYAPGELLNVIGELDYFISVLPSTPQTRNMIGMKEFSVMKPSAFFINMGRGDAVNETDLIEALKTGKIAGAGLDVFFREPLPPESPLWEMENVMITPHVGGVSDIYIEQALPIVRENLRRYLNHEQKDLINLIEH
jgi:D-2-hydroxyacid dehydrogenase (NADP+)